RPRPDRGDRRQCRRRLRRERRPAGVRGPGHRAPQRDGRAAARSADRQRRPGRAGAGGAAVLRAPGAGPAGDARGLGDGRRRRFAVTKAMVKALDGNTFVVSDVRGDIEASPTDPTGLFSYDTRFLSRWVLTVDDQRLTALSTDDLNYFETKHFLVPGTGTV